MSRPVQPGEFKRRIYNGSGLDIIDRALLAYLAWHAEKHRDAEGWFAVDQDTIAKDNGCTRRTVGRRLPRLIEAGWLRCRKQVKDGRYQTTEYRLTVPVPGDSESHGNGQNHATESPTVPWDSAHAQPWDSESQQVRSYLPRESATARPAAAPEQTTQPEPQAPPVPAARVAADPVSAETAAEEELLDQWQAEHRDYRYRPDQPALSGDELAAVLDGLVPRQRREQLRGRRRVSA